MTPIRICATSRCGNQAAPGKARCPIHMAEQRKANRSAFDGFYSSKAWRLSRRRQLFAYPLCQYRLEDGTGCDLLADSVHHIVELEDGGAARDPANLMSVCRSHHSVIHAQRRRGAANAA
jgi:5-methylcytosine-specific restriction endonuclease McrA